ncbi:MAG: hypothetical protein QF420_02920 [Alphaproteobacteria bacterium]|nr:hypothetical protein [Alphaproteobacteria bacterium]
MSFFDFSSFTFFGLLPLPLWKVLIDAVFAVLMWVVLVRFAVMVLFGENPPVRALLSFVQLTDIVIRLSKLFMPAVLTPASHNLYAAFLLFLLRYYGLPVLNNYPINGPANLPFEAHLAAGLSALSHLISGIGS